MYDGNSPSVVSIIEKRLSEGWIMVEIEPQDFRRFCAMKDWCEETAGDLGPEWINVNLRQFMFRRKDLAAMFKLTFWPCE